MQKKFHQYYLSAELAKKYSHSTYLASPANEPEHQVVLIVFASSFFQFPQERAKLVLKAKSIKKLQHPHLVPILDMGIEQEQSFVVREYLPNGSLRSRLKNISSDHLTLREALSIVSQVGQALAYAHEQNIFHGNMKPENILFDADDQAVLTDFNLVNRNDALIRDQTAEEYAFCYMAPEQFAGICDARSDQYALGCLAYELITGHVPFATLSLASMMGHHSNTQPVPLSERVDVPPSLEAAVLKALAKDPDERFYDFSLFLEVIQSVLSPTPVFPLIRSTYSRSNKTISRPALSAKAATISSPIRKRAFMRTAAPQSLEPPEVFSSAEVDTAEPAVTPLTPQASMPETPESVPLSESLETALQSHQFSQDVHSLSHQELPLQEQEHNESAVPMPDTMLQLEGPASELAMITPIPEQEIDDLLLTDPFVEEDVHAIVLGNSVFWQHQDATAEVSSSSTRSTDVPEIQSAQAVPRSRGRKRVLRLALLLSVIVALITSAFWVVGMFTLDGRVPPTQKMTHAVIRSANSTPQTVTIPTFQPVVHATSTPTAQPPIPTKIVFMTIASYEAEAADNTKDGTKIFSCNLCSGGLRVGWISYNIFLQFNHVIVNHDGNYTLTIYYLNSIPDRQTSAFVSVNGGPNVMVPGLQILYVNCCDNIPPQVARMTVSLHAGNNTIRISASPTGYAPDIDRIVVG